MWIIRSIFFGAILVLTLIFAFQNVDTPPVKESLALKFMGHPTPSLPVFVWFVLFFLCGLFIAMAISAFREMMWRAQIARLKSELNEIQAVEENRDHATPNEKGDYGEKEDA
jgi:uncharacterized integral membrane protein